MLKRITTLFQNKRRSIQEEIALKSKIDEVLSDFVRKEVLKDTNLDCRLSYTLNKGIVKIETDNKIIAQEIALRTRVIEDRLRKEGVVFRKLLV